MGLADLVPQPTYPFLVLHTPLQRPEARLLPPETMVQLFAPAGQVPMLEERGKLTVIKLLIRHRFCRLLR